jgi:hypothetical protein
MHNLSDPGGHQSVDAGVVGRPSSQQNWHIRHGLVMACCRSD